MMRLRRMTLVVLLMGALQSARALQPRSAHAQDLGVAAIAAPLEGAVVSGLVPILGTATHPQFQRYELAFGYDPNPTDTWFSIGEPDTSQVVNDVLGSWDTAGLTDGAYVLRLRVYWSDRDFLETFVRRVRIQNATPTATSTPRVAAATGTPPPPSASTAPAAGAGTQPVIALPPTSTPRPTLGPVGLVGSGGGPVITTRLNAKMIVGAFLDGVRLTAIIFTLLGAYTGLRALVRSRWRR
jgi:hypothetical protein